MVTGCIMTSCMLYIYCPLSLGIATLPGGVAGLLLGGAVIKRWNLSLTSILKLMIATNVCILITLFMFAMRCKELEFAGITEAYDRK